MGTGGQGLWRIPPASQPIEKSTALTGLSNDAIQCLLEDREGNIWVATLDGLNRLTPHKVSQVVDAGLVSSVQATADGSVWIGNIDSLIQYVDGKLHQRREPQTLAGPPLSAMHADAAGVLWVATSSGLSRIARGHRESIALPHHFHGRPVAAIAADGDGGVWLSDLEHRVVRWTHGRSEALTLPAGIGDVRIMSIHGDRQGRLWLALADGRLAIAERSGRVAVHESSDGLQAGVYGSLLEDRSGTVWLGGTEGLSRLVKGRFETLSRTSGFPSGSLIAILEDDAGRLWIALEGVGVVRIAKTELERAFEMPSHRVRFRLYDRSDGVAGTPQGYGNSSAARASDGRLWFVSGRGATVFDPATLDDAPESPLPVHIESVVLNGQRLSRALSSTLPPTTTQLEIAYTVLNLTSPLRTQFRYRLDGFDADWIEAGARRQAFYTNLPPGQYHFRVMAGDQEHGWNEPAASIWSFAITPAFHQTTWFYVAAIAVAGLTIGAAWRFRLAQVRKQFSLVLGERARLSREIHDTLLQSMVGIALRFDAMAKDLEPSQSATRDELVRIRRDVEDYIREARQSIWDLRSPRLAKHDLATALREAGEHAVDGHPITFDLVVSGTPHRAESRVEEQLLRIGQEAILNAIRHSGASRISMELRYEEQTIVMKVSDDGGGFDYGQARGRSDGHFGLSSMQERAARRGRGVQYRQRAGARHRGRGRGSDAGGALGGHMRPAPIRVLCVDDHRIVREGIALIIGRQPDMKVVGSAATGEEAIELFQRHHPSVTLMDLQLGRMSGVETIRAIRRLDKNARIVVLTMYQGDEDIYRAVEAGAATYLLKDMLSDDLIRVVREVHAGERPVSPSVQALLSERAGRPTLTPREVQVVELIAQGMRNKEIAISLGISEETAQVHVRNILAKLKVQDRTAVIQVAVRRGIIHFS